MRSRHFIYFFYFIVVIWHWPEAICVPRLWHDGHVSVKAHISGFGFAINDFIPTWIVLAPTFRTESLLVRVCVSRKGENNLEWNHILRSLTFGKRILTARSRWCQHKHPAQELLRYNGSPICAHGNLNFKPSRKRKYSSRSDNTVKASKDQTQTRASSCCCCWSLSLSLYPCS